MKLDIQLFAYSQTILNNQKSTGSSPTAYYTVTAEPNNAARTATTINIKVNVKSSLGSGTSSLTTGPTMGLNAYFKFNGESKTLKLKATDSGWSGTTAHYATAEWSIPLAATATSLPNITFRVERTGNAAGTTDTSKGAWLKDTACSNITGIAQGLTAPTITVGYNEPNDIATRFYINANQASNIYYQFNNTGNFEKIGDNVVSCEKALNNLSPNTTYTVKFQAKNPADENLFSEIETITFTTSPNPYFKSGPGNLTLSSGTTDATLYFSNPHGRAITITPSSGIGLSAQTIYGESVTFKLDQSKLYQAIPSATKGTIVYSYVITTASGSKINGSYSQTYSTSEQTCKPSIDTTKFKYSAQHQSGYSWYTGAGLINNHSTLNVWYENGLASPNKGAGISSIKFTFAGVTKDIGTSSVNYGMTYNYTAPTAGTITVTDTRNYSSTANVNIAFVKYEIPKAWISAVREGGYGASVSISVGGSTSLAGNSLTQYQWSPDFSTWYNCDAQGKAATSISSDESKVLYCAVKDKAGNWSDYSTMSATARVTVPKGQPLMFIDSGVQGVGVNCFPTSKGLEVTGPIKDKGTSLSLASGIPANMEAKTTALWNDAIAFRGASNDAAWIRFNEDTPNAGFLEISTGDDSTEPIYVRQYNTSSNIIHEMRLLDSNGNLTNTTGNLWSNRGNSAESCVGASTGSSSIYLFANPDGRAGIYSGNFGDVATHSANSTDKWQFNGNASTASYANSAGTTSGLSAQQRNKTGTWMPVIQDGRVDYTLRVLPTTVTSCDWDKEEKHDYIATIAMLAYWNGAYNTGNNSNLTYCYQGTIQAKPTVLYNNSSGTTTTFSLSETAANFDYIVFMYKCQNGNTVGGIRSTTVADPNSQVVEFSANYDNGSYLYICNAKYTISGTTVTKNKEVRWRLTPSSSSTTNTRTDTTSNDSNIQIYKVIGYRK